MKTISFLMATGLSMSGLIMSANPSFAADDQGSSIHIDQSSQFPETRWADANHYLRVHVPANSADLSALTLQVPSNLRFNANQIEVLNLQGQKISTVINERIDTQSTRRIQISFVDPIIGGSKIDLRISNVKKILISQPATYSISVKLASRSQLKGAEPERYIGDAHFRSY